MLTIYILSHSDTFFPAPLKLNIYACHCLMDCPHHSLPVSPDSVTKEADLEGLCHLHTLGSGRVGNRQDRRELQERRQDFLHKGFRLAVAAFLHQRSQFMSPDLSSKFASHPLASLGVGVRTLPVSLNLLF